MTKFLFIARITVVSTTIFVSSSAMQDQKSGTIVVRSALENSQSKKPIHRTSSLKALQEAMQNPRQHTSSDSQHVSSLPLQKAPFASPNLSGAVQQASSESPNISGLLPQQALPDSQHVSSLPRQQAPSESSNISGVRTNVEEPREVSAESPLAKLMSDPLILKGLSTPLHLAAAQGLATMVQFLVDAGAKTDAKDDAGLIPLQLCLAAGHAPAAAVLLEKQAGRLGWDSTFKHALHAAAAAGHAKVVQLLLEKKMEINRRDDKGSTPLHLAAKNGHEAVVQLLLDAGADTNVRDEESNTAFDCAALASQTAVFELLKQKKKEQTPLAQGSWSVNEIDWLLLQFEPQLAHIGCLHLCRATRLVKLAANTICRDKALFHFAKSVLANNRHLSFSTNYCTCDQEYGCRCDFRGSSVQCCCTFPFKLFENKELLMELAKLIFIRLKDDLWLFAPDERRRFEEFVRTRLSEQERAVTLRDLHKYQEISKEANCVIAKEGVKVKITGTQMSCIDGMDELLKAWNISKDQVVALDFSRNKIASLPRSFFEGFIRLREIDMNDNDLLHLERETFPASVEKLDLGNNRIITLPDDFFSPLSRLRVVSLIGSVSKLPESVYGLKQLKELRLSRNLVKKDAPANIQRAYEAAKSCSIQ